MSDRGKKQFRRSAQCGQVLDGGGYMLQWAWRSGVEVAQKDGHMTIDVTSGTV
ncbi:MAG: hypothetical protein JXB30_08275 [Anaerolineae bacterium]|nr:hypothetical protein [Anaerolineae bacterium]